MEGIIGLIIMIVVLNVFGRLMRSLGSKQQPKMKTGGIGKLIDSIERMADSVKSADTKQEAAEQKPEMPVFYRPGVKEQAVTEPATLFEHERGETAGEHTPWSEDLFEKMESAKAYRAEKHPSPPPVPEKAATKGTSMGKSRKRLRPVRQVHETFIDSMFGTSNLRKAILHSVVLGPCRARKRGQRPFI